MVNKLIVRNDKQEILKLNLALNHKNSPSLLLLFEFLILFLIFKELYVLYYAI